MKYILLLFTLITSYASFTQDQYNYTADLKNIKNDQVAIELQTPAIKEDKATFSFPKAIPGSYSNKDFGRFIDDFKAYNKEGKSLKVKSINNNQFEISNAQTLQKITYKVDDTWDKKHNNFVFQPGGSNIDAGNNFVLNNHAFFGYFEGYKMLPFQVQVSKPAELYGATHLNVNRISPEQDVLQAKNYVYLADNPVIYARPDTTSFLAGNTRINVSVYSATHKVTSTQVAEYLKPMSVALSKFFNGLPVDSYQFLFYFDDPDKALTGKDQGGYGALEHNYSSLYYLPEIALESRLHSMVNEVTSHEFLHIQTPLNLHSKEIEDFDYINPKMSQHLWLYEGVTEYFAHLVQLQNGLLDEEHFFKNMRDKMSEAEKLGVFSMTEMSKKVLTEEYKSKYASVYNKGALIGFMLDLFIRDKTKNQKDLKSVIKTLSQKYGPNKPFEDDELFGEIVKASHPDVQQFIDKYIKGSEPLPFAELLPTIGYEFAEEKKKDVYFAGNLGLKYDDVKREFIFTDVEKNAVDIKDNDVFVSVNNEKITDENFEKLFGRYFKNNTTTPDLTLVVRRKGTEKTLSGHLYNGYMEMKRYVGPLDQQTTEQKANLDKLLGK